MVFVINDDLSNYLSINEYLTKIIRFLLKTLLTLVLVFRFNVHFTYSLNKLFKIANQCCRFTKFLLKLWIHILLLRVLLIFIIVR
jgi:hypothetical protein